jgi:hypothetical protein
MDWYQVHEFACKLGQITGKNYHMMTEAEFEYAAKNHLSSLEKIGGGSSINGEEWAYNTWSSTHSGGTDPIGPKGPMHDQKTRRDANPPVRDNITGRLIRSIDGTGPSMRLALSKDMAYPPDMVPPCDIHAPKLTGDEPENSYRDMRWVTGSGAEWVVGKAIGNFKLRAWEDGTAILGNTNGQWFTSNNINFVFVSTSGSVSKFPYIFLGEIDGELNGSLISDKSYMNGGFVGRIIKKPASNLAKPTVSGLKSGKDLAEAQTDFNTYFKMVNMKEIPDSEKQQDSRLLDGTDKGWFQDNRQAGGTHHYRKDIDLDEFRFTVNLGGDRIMLSNGKWFTVNNTFLRVTHSTGYIAEYLYTVTPEGTLYHNSFMGYERADFRMFEKTTNNSSIFAETCGISTCGGEIPKGEGVSFHSYDKEKGQSTFVPAPCPSGGCK